MLDTSVSLKPVLDISNFPPRTKELTKVAGGLLTPHS